MSSRRHDRREKSFSTVSAHPFYSQQTSLFNTGNDETAVLSNGNPSIDPYQSSVEYRLQELTKRLATLENRLSTDVSTILTILQDQFPSSTAVTTDTTRIS